MKDFCRKHASGLVSLSGLLILILQILILL